MARTQIPGTGILNHTVEEIDLADGAVTGPKLGPGALIGVDIMPYSDALAPDVITTKTQSGILSSTEKGLILIDCSTNNITLTLPSAAANPGLVFKFKKIDNTGNIALISATGGELIDTITQQLLSVQSAYLVIQSDGSTWRIISQGPANLTLPTLITGEPAYFDSTFGELISISRATLSLSYNSTRVRNRFLRYTGDISFSSTYGYRAPRNCYITDISVQIQRTVTTDVYFDLYINGTYIDYIMIPQGQTVAYWDKILTPINQYDHIAMYLTSSKDTRRPICSLQMAWRN